MQRAWMRHPNISHQRESLFLFIASWAKKASLVAWLHGSLRTFCGTCRDRTKDAAKVCPVQCKDYIGFLGRESDVACASVPQTRVLQTFNCMDVKTEQIRSVARYSIWRIEILSLVTLCISVKFHRGFEAKFRLHNQCRWVSDVKSHQHRGGTQNWRWEDSIGLHSVTAN
jgi:hypothetical protein